MVAGLLGNESSDSNRFTLVTPKSENDVRLQATLGNQNPTDLPVGVVRGYIIDLYQMIIPASPESLGLRIVILLAGNLCTAFGIYTMVQSHLVLAPVDGVILSVSNHYNKAYSLCKNCSDITMILCTIILCLVTRSPFYGIGVGTIFSALCVGRIIKWFEIKQFSLIRS